MSKKGLSSIKNLESRNTWLADSLKFHQYAGLCLSGGKSNKTSLAVVQYYPKQRKIFLERLEDKISSDPITSADEKLLNILGSYKRRLKALAIDAPSSLPKCIRCRLKCPGYNVCTVSEISWLRQEYKKINNKKKPKVGFTPYTQRCAEVYIAKHMDEPFYPSHALGSNGAPLTARANYLSRHIKQKKIEFYPKLSLWRIGRSLGVQKSYLRFHKNSADGNEIREAILAKLIDKDVAFIYDQDLKTLIKSPQAFEAFLGALTSVLYGDKQVEAKPKGFPKSASWIEIPNKEIIWRDLTAKK